MISLSTLFVLVLVCGLWCRLVQARQRVVLSEKQCGGRRRWQALLQVGATVTEWSRTDYTAIVAATARALLVASAWPRHRRHGAA